MQRSPWKYILTISIALPLLIGCGEQSRQPHSQKDMHLEPLILPGDSHDRRRDNDEYQRIITSQRTTMSDMEQRIKDLEQALRAAGRGAYRMGPSLRHDRDQGDSSMLARLHALETEKSALAEQLDESRDQTRQLRERLASSEERGERLRIQVSMLRDADDQLEAVQQERREVLRELQRTQDLLAATEVERLRVERRFFDLMREVITMRSDDSQRLITLQSRLRGEAATLRPRDMEDTPRERARQ
ncbi:MAG: hypothetical protein EA401_05805 [Planctomycetota bacterium]|nr:MAG: hypothetical protein EA401_05805 [Planctomycetota bacterium]